MKLFILRPLPNLGKDDPWEPCYDKSFGFVVRAINESEARKFAHARSGEESDDGINPWLDAKYSSCDELTRDGEAGIIIRDFHAS